MDNAMPKGFLDSLLCCLPFLFKFMKRGADKYPDSLIGSFDGRHGIKINQFPPRPG